MKARGISAIVGIASLTLVLAACGGESSTSGSAPACDSATLLAAANASVTNEEDKASAMDDVQCDGDFAVGFATMGTGDGEIQVTDVFKATDGSWAIIDRTTVCGTIKTDAPAERPEDAQVPESIWAAACNTN